MSESERAEALQGFSEAQLSGLVFAWRGVNARQNQIQPAGDWRYWLLLAGRGFGKTRTGAETVREWAETKLPAPIHLIAPTSADIRDVMIEGSSGILSCYPPGLAPKYQPSKRHRLSWHNGNVAYGFSADEPERLRGPQCCRFWSDEIAAWRYHQDAWDNLMMGFRIGDDLRGVITTTPKPITLLREIIANPATTITRGSSYDNRSNLSTGWFAEIIRKYEGTRLGRQELMAELLDDVPGALWTYKLIDDARIKLVDVRWDRIIRIVVAIDPAVTKTEESNETGIVVGGLTISGHVIVLDDGSGKYTAKEWAKRAVDLYRQWKADCIVGEVNNGGDLVAANIYGYDVNVPFRAVRASRGKRKRAEPVSMLYEQGRVHHVGAFPTLETQMCSWTPLSEEEDQEDDRMDALVWMVTELLIDTAPVTGSIALNNPAAYRIGLE